MVSRLYLVNFRAMNVVLLPGDGIGPEVVREARRALERLAPEVELEEHAFGAAAIRAEGTPLPPETLDACLAADAVLKGPIGDPEFDAAEVRPEQGLLALRKALDVYANLRPARAPGIDVLIVRELVGGSTSARGASAPTGRRTTPASTTRARSSGSRAARSSSRGCAGGA